MTTNQIAYRNYEETRRSNLANEALKQYGYDVDVWKNRLNSNLQVELELLKEQGKMMEIAAKYPTLYNFFMGLGGAATYGFADIGNNRDWNQRMNEGPISTRRSGGN